jgi:hypothetical protein
VIVTRFSIPLVKREKNHRNVFVAAGHSAFMGVRLHDCRRGEEGGDQ